MSTRYFFEVATCSGSSASEADDYVGLGIRVARVEPHDAAFTRATARIRFLVHRPDGNSA